MALYRLGNMSGFDMWTFLCKFLHRCCIKAFYIFAKGFYNNDIAQQITRLWNIENIVKHCQLHCWQFDQFYPLPCFHLLGAAAICKVSSSQIKFKLWTKTVYCTVFSWCSSVQIGSVAYMCVHIVQSCAQKHKSTNT